MTAQPAPRGAVRYDAVIPHVRTPPSGQLFRHRCVRLWLSGPPVHPRTSAGTARPTETPAPTEEVPT